MRALLSFLRLSLFLIWVVAGIPFQMLWLCFDKGRSAYTIPLYWHRVLWKILNIRCIVQGVPETKRQTIFIANHLSYLDITIMAGTLPASFVAKSEVARWPVFGTLARLQRTIFVSRNASRTHMRKEGDALEARLYDGTSLIVFAEGTSSDGRAVLPFKAGLLAPILSHERAAEMLIQPVSIVIEQVDGRSPDQDEGARDLYAWHGDMTMLPHLWGFTGGKGAVIRLIFHPARPAKDFTDRKALAAHCHSAVSWGVREKSESRPLAEAA